MRAIRSNLIAHMFMHVSKNHTRILSALVPSYHLLCLAAIRIQHNYGVTGERLVDPRLAWISRIGIKRYFYVERVDSIFIEIDTSKIIGFRVLEFRASGLP